MMMEEVFRRRNERVVGDVRWHLVGARRWRSGRRTTCRCRRTWAGGFSAPSDPRTCTVTMPSSALLVVARYLDHRARDARLDGGIELGFGDESGVQPSQHRELVHLLEDAPGVVVDSHGVVARGPAAARAGIALGARAHLVEVESVVRAAVRRPEHDLRQRSRERQHRVRRARRVGPWVRRQVRRHARIHACFPRITTAAVVERLVADSDEPLAGRNDDQPRRERQAGEAIAQAGQHLPSSYMHLLAPVSQEAM